MANVQKFFALNVRKDYGVYIAQRVRNGFSVFYVMIGTREESKKMIFIKAWLNSWRMMFRVWCLLWEIRDKLNRKEINIQVLFSEVTHRPDKEE
jgi:hypothetical protein